MDNLLNCINFACRTVCHFLISVNFFIRIAVSEQSLCAIRKGGENENVRCVNDTIIKLIALNCNGIVVI